jgi:hypothetical protein
MLRRVSTSGSSSRATDAARRAVLSAFRNTFEVIWMSLFKAPMIGIVTFVRNLICYHFINMSVPQSEVSGLNVFHEMSRVLPPTSSHSAAPFASNVSLQAIPMSLPPGSDRLHREGDWSGEVAFAMGETVDSFGETPSIMRPSTAWTVIFVMSSARGSVCVIKLLIRKDFAQLNHQKSHGLRSDNAGNAAVL